MEIRISRRAERDLINGNLGWRARYTERPDEFVDRVAAVLELLRANPRLGRATLAYKDARVFVLADIEHLLFYRPHRRHIAVLAVVPSKRQRATP